MYILLQGAAIVEGTGCCYVWRLFWDFKNDTICFTMFTMFTMFYYLCLMIVYELFMIFYVFLWIILGEATVILGCVPMSVKFGGIYLRAAICCNLSTANNLFCFLWHLDRHLGLPGEYGDELGRQPCTLRSWSCFTLYRMRKLK